MTHPASRLSHAISGLTTNILHMLSSLQSGILTGHQHLTDSKKVNTLNISQNKQKTAITTTNASDMHLQLCTAVTSL